MKRAKAKLYVGCALTVAPEEFKNSVENLKSALRQQGYEVFDFTGLRVGDPAQVYNWDIGNCVKNCDAFIAICDFASLGLGFEIGEAVRLKKPVLAIAHNDSPVTRLLIGAAEVEPNLTFKRYQNIQKDAVFLVSDWLKGRKVSV